MSGFEVLATAACVAGIISAYREGGDLVRTLKDKRRARKSIPSNHHLIELSLGNAIRDIQSANGQGVGRFGDLFRRGDQIAVEQLREIRSSLRTSLLPQIATACGDDPLTDVQALVDASDLGRVKTVTTLSELFMRTLQAVQLRDLSPSQLTRSSTNDSFSGVVPNEAPVTRVRSQDQDERRRYRWRPWKRRISDISPGQSAFTKGAASLSPSSTTMTRSPPYMGPVDLSTMSGMSGTMAMSGTSEMSEEEAHDWALLENPWIDEDENEILEQVRTARGSISSIQRTPSPLGRPSMSSLPQSPQPSVESCFDYSVTMVESFQSRATSSAGLTLLRLPNAENNYLGFCKGAVKLQGRMDSDAMKVSFDIRYMQSKVEFLQCSHCAFAGRVSRSRIWEEKERGVRFRWTFLAKSHVHQSKAAKESYTYQCQFCAFQYSQSAVIQGTDAFMEHVASHRGEALTHAMLDRIRCVNDGFAEQESDDWDINLLPLNYQSPSISPNTAAKLPREPYSPSYFPKYDSFPFRRKSPGPSLDPKRHGSG